MTYTEDEFWKYFSDQNVIYTKTDGQLSKAENDNFQLCQYKEISSDRFVTPQLISFEPDKFFDQSGEAYSTQDAVNEVLYKKFKILEKYESGKCIFIVPIEHYRESTNILYGVVRNHSYTLTISNISGFGRGIGSGNTKITDESYPEMPDSYKINTALTINTWTKHDQTINISQ